jgi:hypothetical protein
MTKAHAGHSGCGGLQKHSIGPIYPWTIVVSPSDKEPLTRGTIRAVHAEHGQHLPAHAYTLGQQFSLSHSFEWAYNAATADAMDKLL